MSHLSKIVSLVATVVLFAGGIALAADPKKVPPKLSPSQTPPAKFVPRPDLVPVKLAGGKVVTGFHSWCGGNKLVVMGEVMNGGNDRGGSFKVLVRVNGLVWNIPNNPRSFSAGPFPGHTISYIFEGWVPGPGPIPNQVLVSVEVDPENTVAELNEKNNVATVRKTPCK